MKPLSLFPGLLLTLVVAISASAALGSATIIIQNNDPAGQGFNDLAQVTPIGGNTGTTVGQQRLNAFTHAAMIWGQTLTSGPTIVIRANWSTTMTCSATSGTLGSASAISFRGNFPGAPFSDTWYNAALANALSNTDGNGATAEINAQFNAKLGNEGCLEDLTWYYGLNTNNSFNEINLVTVLLHEFAHGLGFATATSSATGAQLNGFPTIYDRFLLDNTTGKTWIQMTDAERVSSAINTSNLVWNGPQATIDSAILSSGRDSQGRPQVYAPNPRQPGSSVSHWTNFMTPTQLMEPNNSPGLSHSVTLPQDLTFSLLRDIGWCSGCPQPPPPPPPPAAPANDDFVNAQAIAGCSGSVTGTNVSAKRESGEPRHSPDDNEGGASVWYQWQAPSNTSVTITTEGSNYDTLLGVYTGSAVNGLTLVDRNDDVELGTITTSSVTFTASAGQVYRIAVDGWGGDTGDIKLNWNQVSCTPPANTVQFVGPTISTGEEISTALVVVNRGDASGAATVDYSTNDFMAARCDTVSGNASAKCDYATAGGTLRFAAGDSSKTIVLSIVNDAFVEGGETLTITLSNATGVTLGTPSVTTVTITDNDSNPNAENPFLNNAFFVRQQYLDFLLREPDTAGFNDWLTVLNGCGPGQGWLGSPPGCDRVHVSSGFFRSTEFGEKGYWIYRFYEGALGRRPAFAEFMPEVRRLSGLMTDAEQEARRADFISRFMQLPEFTGIFAGLTDSPSDAAAFVAKLEEKARVTLPATATTEAGQPPQYGRQELIDKMANGQFTAAQTMRAFIEQKVVWDAYFFRAFVAMQYFGYLRRDPEPDGYDDWVRVLTFGDVPSGTAPGDFRHLIFGFVYSVEYRERFGKP